MKCYISAKVHLWVLLLNHRFVNLRIFCQPSGFFTIEIDPGDGSVMRSRTPRGRYFDHWFVWQNGVKV